MDQFNEAVVGYRSGELSAHMLLHVIAVEVLHTPETAEMEEYLNGDDLAVGHDRFLLRCISDQVPIEFLLEILSEFIRQIEYLCNFILCDLHGNLLTFNMLDHINVGILPQITYWSAQ